MTTIKKVRDFTNLLYENGLQQIITKRTRISNKTSTLIDNIAFDIRLTDNSIKTRIIETDIFDHFPIYVLLKLNSQKKSDKNSKTSMRNRTVTSAIKKKLHEKSIKMFE